MKLPSFFRNRMTEVSLTVIFVLGFLALVVTSNGVFLSRASLQGFLTYLAVPITIGLAQMVVLSIGQMNLAVGTMGGVTCAIMAVLMADHNVPIWLAIPIAFLGFPYILVIAIMTAILLSLFFSRTIMGRRILATGGNPLAARLSGVSNNRSVFLAHTLSGLLIGVAAVITIASLPGINRSIGGDWLLASFAAPIIGGVLMSGGTIAIYGTVIAAGVVRLVDIARAQYSLDPSIVSLSVGVVTLSTVALSEWRRRRTERANEGIKGVQ